jgi:urocanate hydratase
LDVIVTTMDEAITLARKIREEWGSPGHRSCRKRGGLLREAYEKGFVPDVMSELCPCHDPFPTSLGIYAGRGDVLGRRISTAISPRPGRP